eukprot:3748389-Ditylum_brightwellii.AAC.1
MLKKRQSANNYYHIREAVAANIVSMQFLLKNQTFPQAETVGECQAESSESGSGKDQLAN